MSGEAIQGRIDLRVTGGEAADKAALSLDKLAAAHDGVAVSLRKSEKVRESLANKLERQARRDDVLYRNMQREKETLALLDKARSQGLHGSEQFSRIQNALAQAHAASTLAVNDNSAALGLNRNQQLQAIHVGRSLIDMLASGQSVGQALTIEGSRIVQLFASGQGGAAGTLAAFGGIAVRALTSPLAVAGALAAGLLGVKAAGESAATSLAALGEQSRQIGLSANEITGAKIVGARAGLDDKASFGALQTATRQYEQFARNAGSVKDVLEHVDKGFLKVADSARSSSEWIDRIEQEIRKLAPSQGLELSKALFGEDAGAKLFDNIRSGEASMSSLRAAAAAAGADFDVSAASAEKMRREIAEIDAIASTRLLATFGALADPVLVLEKSWANMKLGILDVERSARQLRDTLRFNAGQALGEHGEAASSVFARMRQQKLGDPFSGLTEKDIPDLPNLFTQGQKMRTVGQDRALFVKPEKAHSGKSAAEKEADAYEKISKELQGQIGLLQTSGAEHDKLAVQLKIEAEQAKLGKDASKEHRDHIADLVTNLDTATKAQQRFNEELTRARQMFENSLNTFVDGIQRGENAGKSLSNVLKMIERDLLRIATKSLSDSLFGTGKSGAGTGLLGGLLKSGLGALGLGGGGGGFGGYMGTGEVFADGGIVGAPGGKTMRAPLAAFAGAPHFASGGAVPVIAHAGEVILNQAQQRNVAAAMMAAQGRNQGAPRAAAQQRVEVHNYAAGVEVTPRMTPQGVALIVQEIGGQMIRANNKQIPGMLTDSQRRAR